MSSIAKDPMSDLEGLLTLPRVARLGAAPAVRRFEQLATAAEMVGDFLASVLGVCAAYLAYHSLDLGKQVSYRIHFVLSAAALFSVVYVIMLDRDGAYRQGHGLLRIRETERALRVAAQTFLLFFPLSFFAATLVSRWVLAFAFVFVPIVVVLQKQLFFVAIRALHARGIGIQRVLIYGAGFTGKRVYSALVRSPKLGLDPVVLVDDGPGHAEEIMYAFEYRRVHQAPITRGPVTPEIIRQNDIDMVVIAIPSLGREKFAAVTTSAIEGGAKLAYVPAVSLATGMLVDYADVDGIMVASFGAPRSKHSYELTKRAFDCLVASLVMVLCAPLLAVVALAVRFNSKGPILFRQQRVGKNGKKFEMYKIRTMYVDAPKYGFSPKESEDPRITRVGRFLRKTSLDELPQIFNVLKGDMSLVGPRPEMPFIVEQYGVCEHQRLQIKPGITGLWQLSADRAFLIHENIQYDLYYIRNRGFFMDIAILLHTIIFAMKGI